MHTSVFSVPPEAVNMSLGLSLAAATVPPQLLVSCPPSEEGLEGERWKRRSCWAGGLVEGGGAAMGELEAGTTV